MLCGLFKIAMIPNRNVPLRIGSCGGGALKVRICHDAEQLKSLIITDPMKALGSNLLSAKKNDFNRFTHGAARLRILCRIL